MTTVWGRVTACLVLAAVVGAAPAPAAADAYDDIEQRLKTTGVSASLAREIARTIRQGAKFLLGRQARDGSWNQAPGQTVLCALALTHTADKEATEGARRALRWALKNERAMRRIRSQTYEAGIMAMLLHALEPESPLLRDLQRRLERGPTGGGYWGYAAAGESGKANLSTSQFACLGLWAAQRAGNPRSDAAWQIHRDGLLRAQTVDGSWSYWAHTVTGFQQETGYATGTFMGLADLVLSRRTEIPKKASDAERWYRALWQQRAAEVAFARHVRWILTRDEARRTSIGAFPYYSLYAIEKAGIFLDVETAGGIDWYDRGARLLVSSQANDGRFTVLESDSANRLPGGVASGSYGDVPTAFALLFLLRMSEVYRPITPRGMPKPTTKGPVTGPQDLPDADGADEPDPNDVTARPPLALAYRMLDWIEKRVRVLEMSEVPELTRLIEFVRRTLPRYIQDGKAIDTLHDAWVRRAEQILVELCQPGVASQVTDQAWRLELAAHALSAMAHATPRGAALLRKSIHPRVFERYGQRRCGIAYFGALIRALREAGLADFPTWVIDTCIWPDAKQRVMTIPALIELAQIRETNEETLRRTARRLLYKMKELERSDDRVGPTGGLQVDTLLTVLALVGTPEDEGFGRPGRTLAAWRKRVSR